MKKPLDEKKVRQNLMLMHHIKRFIIQTRASHFRLCINTLVAVVISLPSDPKWFQVISQQHTPHSSFLFLAFMDLKGTCKIQTAEAKAEHKYEFTSAYLRLLLLLMVHFFFCQRYFFLTAYITLKAPKSKIKAYIQISVVYKFTY